MVIFSHRNEKQMMHDTFYRRVRTMSNITLDKVIKEFSLLPLEDKEYAVDIIEKQLTEAKREAIAKSAKKAMVNLKKGAVKKGAIKDLYKDLEID
jgi:hypothetical protein